MLRFVSIVASSIGFYLPLAAVPMYAAAAGSATAGGLANGVLLVATVAGELATPRFVARVGYRWALSIGLVLLGAPALVLLATSSFAAVFAVNAARGVGFAITVTAGGALTAALIPDGRRGEGLALVGLVGGVPSLLALPFGAWAAMHWGFAARLRAHRRRTAARRRDDPLAASARGDVHGAPRCRQRPPATAR